MKNLKLTLKAWPAITLITVALCCLTQNIAKLFGIELPDQSIIDIVKAYAGWNWRFVFIVAQIVIILPVIEELLFRGLLFKLPSRWGGKGATITAVIVSSVLFSAAHYIDQPFPDSAFIALFAFGIAQCWLYRKTNAIWSPMLNHALFNLTNLLLMFIVE